MSADLESIDIVGVELSLFDKLKTCSMEACINYLQQQKRISVDTETSGLDFTSKDLIMLQVGTAEHQFIIDVRYTKKEELKQLRQIFENEEITKIFHNAKFDYKFIKKTIGCKIRNIYDTMLAEIVLTCGRDDVSYGLEALAEKYLKVVLSKTARHSFINLAGAPFTYDQMVYGAKDIKYLEQIVAKQAAEIKALGLENVVMLENKAVEVFSEIEYEGLLIDLPSWKELGKQNAVEAHKLMMTLDDMVIQDDRLQKFKANKQLDFFLSEEELKSTSISWSSPTQVLKVFKILEPSIENVNGKKIAPFRYKHPLINQYIKYKEKDKLVSAFGDNFDKLIDKEGKIHTNFRQILDTGRVSSSEPNMQQIPANNTYRNCFVAPEGYVFVSSDYSSQELNVIAFGSGDPVFLKALENNEDLHSVCAELVFQDVWRNAAEEDCAYVKSKEKCECKAHKKLRTNVKTINFG